MNEDDTSQDEKITEVISHFEFLLGCEKDDEAIKCIRDNEVPVDHRHLGYIPLLYLAARKGRVHVVKWLIDQGADIVASFGERAVADTPFAAAVYARSAETMALLYYYENQLDNNPVRDRTLFCLGMVYREPGRSKQFHEECERLAKENLRLPESTIKRLREKYPPPEDKSLCASPVAMFHASTGSATVAGSPKGIGEREVEGGRPGAVLGAAASKGVCADKSAEKAPLIAGEYDDKVTSGLRRRHAGGGP